MCVHFEKANYRYEGTGQKFIFPYDLGKWENIKQVADPSCGPIGDGIHWKVRSGCNQYTLTVNIIPKIYSVGKRESERKSNSYRPLVCVMA